MKIIAAVLQIQDLFNGNFTWQGLLLVVLFVVMGLIAVGFPIFIGYKAFRSKPKKKNDF